jgi:hypothetical protein
MVQCGVEEVVLLELTRWWGWPVPYANRLLTGDCNYAVACFISASD